MSGSDDLPHGLLKVKKNPPGSKCQEINGINASEAHKEAPIPFSG